MITDITPLIEATKNRKQVTFTYEKKTTGDTVTHTGGIYEIRGDSLWMWDINSNDSIRRLYLSNIFDFQVLDATFFPPQPWPIKIEGEIV